MNQEVTHFSQFSRSIKFKRTVLMVAFYKICLFDAE